MTLLGVGMIEVHVRLGCVGVSIDALDRISFRVGYIITIIIIALVLCVGVGFSFSFVVWASIFSCTTVDWKNFVVFVSGSRGKVPHTGGPYRHPMRRRAFAQVEHRV